jgi:hypothetical protein
MTSIESELYGGADQVTRLMYGRDARHVPAWLYVQDQGPGVVSFVGSSMTRGQDNPLTYGGGHHVRGVSVPRWTHHFVIGEIIVRPHVVIGTNALRGEGLSALATSGHDIEAMLADGAHVAGSVDMLARYARKAGRQP